MNLTKSFKNFFGKFFNKKQEVGVQDGDLADDGQKPLQISITLRDRRMFDIEEMRRSYPEEMQGNPEDGEMVVVFAVQVPTVLEAIDGNDDLRDADDLADSAKIFNFAEERRKRGL